MYKVDLNSDLGESFGRYTLGMDEKIHPAYLFSKYRMRIPCIRSCCDDGIGQQDKGCGHPYRRASGFPDLMGFGRRNMAVSPAEAKAYTLYQISALGGMCQAQGMKLQHVKPHGHCTIWRRKTTNFPFAICEAIKEYDPELIVMGLSGSETIRAAKDCGLKAASEVFADRGYEEDGSLVNRRKEGAFIRDEDEAIARVIRMVKEGKVTAVTGPRHRYPGRFGVRARRRRGKRSCLWRRSALPESRRNRDCSAM